MLIILNVLLVTHIVNRELQGVDRDKKAKGIKLHMIIDENGFLMICVANIHDSKTGLLLLIILREVSNAFLLTQAIEVIFQI